MPALAWPGRATCRGAPVSVPPAPPLLLVNSPFTPDGPPEKVHNVPGVLMLSATPVLLMKGFPVQSGEPMLVIPRAWFISIVTMLYKSRNPLAGLEAGA